MSGALRVGWTVLILAALTLLLTLFGARADANSTPPGSLEQRLVPALAFDGTNYLGSWTWAHYSMNGKQVSANFGTHAARVSRAGKVLDPVRIPVATARSTPDDSEIAFDGANYLVVWAAADHVYGARVAPSGAVLDPRGIPVSSWGHGQGAPAIAFDGTNYLVVWWQRDPNTGMADLYGARVTPEGRVLDPDGIAISTTGGTNLPAIAFDGRNYLVVWQEGWADIHGARVSPAGRVLDEDAIVISAASMQQAWPALAFDGTNYLVVWQDERAGYHPGNTFPTEQIYGARVSPAGTVLDPNGIPISTVSDYQYEPALAFDGTNYLAVWWDGRSEGSALPDIYGARVSPAGSLLDPVGFPISTAPDVQRDPALSFDGTNYLVAWADRRFAPSWGILGARVTPAAQVLDPAGIPISVPEPVPNPPRPVAKRRVPRVIGLRVATARSRIRGARYSVGRIRRVRSQRVGRVLRQSPRAGAVRARGYPVRLVIGRR